MAKLVCAYYPVICIECPDKVIYIKEYIYNQVLRIYESEHRHPGELFFEFGTIRSTCFKSFNTYQKTIDDEFIIDIYTKNSHYVFKCGKDDYSWFGDNYVI